ncbi:uncharacterized protein [Watersipora subatra]|uniref:uncharacterized protein n=1 Tax=Watersipora subatra TaxID=2589382 RepID=UPI00355AFD18
MKWKTVENGPLPYHEKKKVYDEDNPRNLSFILESYSHCEDHSNMLLCLTNAKIIPLARLVDHKKPNHYIDYLAVDRISSYKADRFMYIECPSDPSERVKIKSRVNDSVIASCTSLVGMNTTSTTYFKDEIAGTENRFFIKNKKGEEILYSHGSKVMPLCYRGYTVYECIKGGYRKDPVAVIRRYGNTCDMQLRLFKDRHAECALLITHALRVMFTCYTDIPAFPEYEKLEDIVELINTDGAPIF